MHALALAGVAKNYGSRRVLQHVDCALEAGQAVALAGVNGAGKTTLLRGVLDLVHFNRGTVTIFGRAWRTPAARRDVSYLPEHFVPAPFATGNEVLRHLLALHGVRYDATVAADEALALDLVPSALARPTREYSKGMAQKLGLLACILAGRRLLILDEPLSGLDPRARVRIKERLGRLKASGVTLFYSTHLLADVEELCDRIALLDDGRIVFDDTPAALQAGAPGASLEAAFLARLDQSALSSIT
jgi:ABC-2 type transport system ATP-binding protein